MHGWKYPQNEAKLAKIAREIGFSQVSVSHEVAPLMRLVARGDTTVADAYLSPVLRRYVAGVERELGAPALFMRSSGGLVAGEKFSGKDALLSGPAGGIVGMAAAARAAGESRVIGFDMGGTSTDVSLWAGEFERRQEAMIGGTRVTAPMLRIDTVAAGGGSVCRFDGGRFEVGPESGGAVPGPACYRRGGPLTITDCNLLLGKIRAEHFPPVFGPNGDEPLDLAAASARLGELLDEVAIATGTRPDPLATAEGLIAIAVANMANAIKSVSIARGHDPASYALMSFGGAGGQHACLIAEALGMTRVLVHPLAGVLSAYGIALADRRAVRQVTLGVVLAGEAAWRDALDRLGQEARAELASEDAAIEATVQLRYARSDQGIDVPAGSVTAMAAAFTAAHRERFGFVGSDALVVERVQVEAVLPTRPLNLIARDTDHEPSWLSLSKPSLSSCPGEEEVNPSTSSGKSVWGEVTPFHREMLAAGTVIPGPALIIDPTSTVVVEPNWSAEPLPRLHATPDARGACPQRHRRHQGRSRPPRHICRVVHGRGGGNGVGASA